MFWKSRKQRPSDGPVSSGEPPWSLTGRLVLAYACFSFALVLAAVMFLYWLLQRDSRQDADRQLRHRVQILGMLLKQGKAAAWELKWEVESDWEKLEEPEISVRILDSQLHPFLAAPHMASELPVGVFPSPASLDLPPQAHNLVSPSGRPYRVATAVVDGQEPGKRWVIQAAYDLTRERGSLKEYRYVMTAVLALAAALGFGFGYPITRRGLRPVAEIAQTTRKIRGSTLSERVQVAGLPSELAGLAADFNNMLDHLEESFNRLRQFSADMAHEIRSPLNVLRGQSEVALSRPRSAEEYRDVLVSGLEEYAKLADIVDGLLFIAQAEKSRTPIHRERFDVAEDLRDILEFYDPVIAEKGLSAELGASEPLWAYLDRSLFRRAVVNLISNAITHTPAGGALSIAASQHDSTVQVEVADTGVGISPEHLSHIFERFYRAEPARGRATGGAGLGLSIVKTVMDLHGGSAKIASSTGAGTRLTLVFPKSGYAHHGPFILRSQALAAKS